MAGGDPNLYRYCLNDPLSFTDPTGTDLWEKLFNWYWGGMGGFSQLVDNILLGGATEAFGRTVGEYDCGNASGWEVVGSGVWLGFQLLPVARPVKAVSSGSKALINQVGKTKGVVRNPGGRLGNPATRQQAIPTRIAGYTKHGINSAISHPGGGVSPEAILDAFKNPLRIAYDSSKDVFTFTGKNATVILNPRGEVVTVWPRSAQGKRCR